VTTPTLESSLQNSTNSGLSSEYEEISLDSLQRKKEYDKFLAWAQEEYRKVKNARASLERQWYMNLAFYYGKQNAVMLLSQTSHSTDFKLFTPPAPPWRVRLVLNKIRPLIRTELSKCTSQKPTVTVVPSSTDDDELAAARVGQSIWDDVYRRKRIHKVVKRAMFWTLNCGTAFIKDYWDQTLVDPSSDQVGDFCIEHITPFHLFVPDFLEEEIENQPFLIHASTKNPEWVHHKYSKNLLGKKVEPNATEINDLMEGSFLNMVGASENRHRAVLCLEFWIKAGTHPLFPEGGMVSVLGDDIVQAISGNPYQHGEYPFSKLEHIPSGKFYADSIIPDLIPLQKEYNRTHSQIIEAKNRTAKPQLLAAQGSIDPTKVTSEPGQVILYKMGFPPPQPLPLQSLPPYVKEELETIVRDMDDISGQHEITKGRVPPGVTAATAISFLQEQDDSKLSHTIDSLESAVEKVGKHILSYAHQYWDTPRVVKVIGKDGEFDAQTFKGQDLRGNTDLHVESGSALPTSKAAKQAFIMDLMKMGFIPPDKGLEVMELGGIERLYEDLQTDVRQAQRENLRLTLSKIGPETMEVMQQQLEEPETDPETGEQLPPAILPEELNPNSYDNHQVHILTHNKFRKTQQFETLDDLHKKFFEEHVALHESVVQDEMMQTMMQQLQGQPPVGAPPEGTNVA